MTRVLERGRQARNETRNPAGNGSGSMVAAVEFGAVVARTSTTWPTTRLSRRPTQGRVDPKQDANCGVVGTPSAAGLAEGLLAPLTPSTGGERELLRTGGWGHKPGDTAVNASFDARLVCWAAARWCYFSRLGRIAAPSSGCRGVLLLLVKHSSWASHDVGVTTSAFLFFFCFAKCHPVSRTRQAGSRPPLPPSRVADSRLSRLDETPCLMSPAALAPRGS